MIHINEMIEGQTFIKTGDTTEWTCIGYASNETFLIVGSNWDQVNNRTTIATFKLKEITFKGNFPPCKH